MRAVGVCGGGSQSTETLSLWPPVSLITRGTPAGRATLPQTVIGDGTLSLSAWYPQAEETRPPALVSPPDHRQRGAGGSGAAPSSYPDDWLVKSNMRGWETFMGGFSVSNKFQGMILQPLIPGLHAPTPNQQKGRMGRELPQRVGSRGHRGWPVRSRRRQGSRVGLPQGSGLSPSVESPVRRLQPVSSDHPGPLRPPPRPWTRSTSK